MQYSQLVLYSKQSYLKQSDMLVGLVVAVQGSITYIWNVSPAQWQLEWAVGILCFWGAPQSVAQVAYQLLSIVLNCVKILSLWEITYQGYSNLIMERFGSLLHFHE